jgi:hypothetical protein
MPRFTMFSTGGRYTKRGAVRSLWRSLKQDLFDNYRPELHYMRGPGPRWNAKHRAPIAAPCDIGAH